MMVDPTGRASGPFSMAGMKKGAAFAAPFPQAEWPVGQGVSSQSDRPKVAARTSESSAATYTSVTLTSGIPAP